MPRFVWTNRFACLERIKLTMQCLQINVDHAIEMALFRTDKHGFKYCNHPELITKSEKHRLRQDSIAVYKKYIKDFEEWKPTAQSSWTQRAK